MRNFSTGSGPSGKSSSLTWTPAARTPTISPLAFVGCNWLRPVWSPPPRGAEWRLTGSGHDDDHCHDRLAPSGRRLARDRAQAAEGLGGTPGRFPRRVVFAAAHVVPDLRAENVPGASAAVDWDATLAFRRHLFRYGLGVAEAMDTAQRNMGLDWPATQELITRSAAVARDHGARIASGAGTDQLL